MPDPALFNAVLRPAFEQLAGLKLAGFAVWERRGGTGRNLNVTFPARQYSINGERRSFALLRPITSPDAQLGIRNAILEAYEKFEKLTTQLETPRTLRGK